jgi:hypothetical protein
MAETTFAEPEPDRDPDTDGWLGDFRRGPAVFAVFRIGPTTAATLTSCPSTASNATTVPARA